VAAAIAGGLVATAFIVLPFAGSLPQLWQQTIGYHLDARAVDVGGIDAPTLLGELPVAALAPAGAILARRRSPMLVAVAAAWGLPAALLLAVQHPVWPHHLVILAPPLSLLAGGLAPLLQGRRSVARGAAALTAVCWLAAAAYTVTLQTPDDSQRLVVAALRAGTAPGDLVVTDDPFAAGLAGRSTPPELVDTTRLRVHSGNLTAAQAEQVTARPNVQAVLLATDRLSTLPGFQDWTAQRFPFVWHLGDGRLLYLRHAPRMIGS
jgi:hypothetical protein